MDGTFSSNPVIFAQLYTVHVKINSEFFPQLWCLLPDKRQATYERLFRLLKNEAVQRNLQLIPVTVHVDFEQAIIQAIRSEFAIEAAGCLFHYAQSILRHVQQIGLQVPYNTNNPPAVRTWIRRLIALPLLPPIRIDQAFQAIVNQAPMNIQGRNDMNTYVMNTYVDANTAVYDRQLWNCFGNQDRTTNVCEGYHSVINAHFNNRHPDPYGFIAFLQQQDLMLERRIAQLQMGAAPKKRKAKYICVDEALERLRVQYFNVGIPSLPRVLQYLDAVGHQLYDVKH